MIESPEIFTVGIVLTLIFLSLFLLFNYIISIPDRSGFQYSRRGSEDRDGERAWYNIGIGMGILAVVCFQAVFGPEPIELILRLAARILFLAAQR